MSSAAYTRLTSDAGLVDLSGRTRIEVRGNDRLQLLHNLCSNDVQRLRPGGGCEAFFCNVQGKIVGYGALLADDKAVLLESAPGQAEVLLPHLERYVIREEVELRDVTAERGALLLAGPRAADLLRSLGVEPPAERLRHTRASVGSHAVQICRVDWTGPDGYLLIAAAADLETIGAACLQQGAAPSDEEALEMARIEAGTPWYGRDVTLENLPQEVNRDRLAISFTKGCYLGQETVARIDALGHVNWLLRGVRFAGEEIPEPGSELRAGGSADERVAGRITSAARSPRLDAPLALAYIRRGLTDPGTPLESEQGPCEIVALPVGVVSG